VTDRRANAAWLDRRVNAAWLKNRARDQAFGKKYFLMLSPSVLNSTRVPRS
jgi:hypothetical protein